MPGPINLDELERLIPQWTLAHSSKPSDGWDAAFALLTACPALIAEVRELREWRDQLLDVAGVTEDLRPEVAATPVVALLSKAANTFAEARAAHGRVHELQTALTSACDMLEAQGCDVAEWRAIAEGRR